MRKVVIVVACLFAIVGMPLVAIWAVNTLFETGIPYTPATWLASFVLLMIRHGGKKNPLENQQC